MLEKLNTLFESLIPGKYAEPMVSGEKNGILY